LVVNECVRHCRAGEVCTIRRIENRVIGTGARRRHIETRAGLRVVLRGRAPVAVQRRRTRGATERVAWRRRRRRAGCGTRGLFCHGRIGARWAHATIAIHRTGRLAKNARQRLVRQATTTVKVVVARIVACGSSARVHRIGASVHSRVASRRAWHVGRGRRLLSVCVCCEEDEQHWLM